MAAVLVGAGCDPVLSARYGRVVDFPAPAVAPEEFERCARSLSGSAAVGPAGEMLSCSRSSRSWRWKAMPERDDLKVSVLVYGDSIAEETSSALTSALGTDFSVAFRVFGGTAPCDWVPQVARDLRAFKPDVVVTSFIGNNITPCAAVDDLKLVEVYRSALSSIAVESSAAGATVVLATSPRVVAGFERTSAVAAVTLETASALAVSGVRVVGADDGVVLSAPGVLSGTFTLPCLAGESDVCQDGVVVVRNGDGVHLCPSPLPRPFRGGCAVRSPGAERYAAALAETVRAVTDGLAVPRTGSRDAVAAG